MAGLPWLTPFSLLIIISLVSVCIGNYIITVPGEWLPGGELQLCVQVTNPHAPEGHVTLGIDNLEQIFSPGFPRKLERVERKVLVPPISLRVPPGILHMCQSLPTSRLNFTEEGFAFRSDELSITGNLNGVNVNHSKEIHRQNNNLDTIIQTDKYLYKPGQDVQFRILTTTGPLLQVSKEPYLEIYITTPSNNRIALWLNVPNPNGLIHLSMQLADEPEEGQYSIVAKTTKTQSARTTFKVEEYVLPRFEVTVKGPEYVLGTANSVSFTACAEYTFGQPVTGEISWEINNNRDLGCRVKISRNDTISNCTNIEVTLAELKTISCSVSYISASATVSEEGTDVQETGKGGVRLSRQAITFKTLRQDDYVKPNLPYTLKLKAEYPDNSPASGEALEVCHGNACKNITTPEDGIITVYLPYERSTQVKIQGLTNRIALHTASYSTQVKPFFSPSNSSLLIYAPEESLECVQNEPTNYFLPLLFSAVDQYTASINVQVMSRGQIQYWKTQDFPLTPSALPFEDGLLLGPLKPTPSNAMIGIFKIPLNLPPTASPKIKVLVWYVRHDGEVVSDVKELTVAKCLQYNVSLDWSTNLTQPGHQAKLTLTSEPDSFCSLGIVDRSVELVAEREDPFTVDKLFQNLFGHELRSFHRQVNDHLYCRRKLEVEIPEDRDLNRYYSDYVDTLQMFDDSGLYIFSDLKLETRPCEQQERRFGAFPPLRLSGQGLIDTRLHSAFGGASFGGSGFSAPSSSSGGPEPDAPRVDFPETWLWDLVAVPSTGVTDGRMTLPDTITEWVGKAVCVHPQKGVGLSERASITTFKPFFVDLTLPPSIKRGEILPVKISVFNYLQQTIPVTVTLESSPEYDIVGSTSQNQLVNQKMSCVVSQGMEVHTVKIRPTVIGQVNITVSAVVDPQNYQLCGSRSTDISRKSDTLVRPITVEAEGFLREESWSRYICAEEVAAGIDTVDMTELSVPPGMVEGSERAWVTAVGDLLAISLQNLGSLIRLPSGCGEQNMINFAPNIYILQYLRATRQETPESTRKLVDFMNKGYQRQLLYRRSNGSYSGFGSADETGSTWLTAFVLKSFAQAREFVVIDKDKFKQTGDWLLESYGRDKCATSIGKVFNKGLLGGLGERGSRVPLTAYILISLLESGMHNDHPAITGGFECLFSDASKDPYTVALKSYAWALKRDTHTPRVIEQLLQQAVVTSNSTYWELPRGPWRSNSLAVETAGYAILAMMTWDARAYEQQARKVVKWISAQRNGQGGFYSTQDTVVALQAMASYESKLFRGDLDVVAQVQAQDFTHSFTIKESHKLLLQMVSLPTLPTKVSFNMIGQGCAVLQTVLRYNDPEPRASDAFSLRVNTRTEPDRFCITKRISACASYLLPDGQSNMAVIEVNLISGYIPEKDDLQKLIDENPKVIKRFDIDGSKLSFYIEEFTAEDVCVNFRVIREVDVEDVKPGSVVVYDYYQPEFSVSKTYNLPFASECRRFK